MHDVGELWRFLAWGYLLTVILETPVLLIGLSPRHAIPRRLFAGAWLTACTYPVVILVLPILVEERWGRGAYLAVAETFAPLAEVLLFYLAFGRGEKASATMQARDFLAIVLANLFSFLLVELMRSAGIAWLDFA